ncbi:hypothetical protein J5N97_005653 [Dioscorea zingiberensis]|uniref:C2H2-type domain-containing protein n=1 Tax=Dioscorea zingiberensis TaxID=325984 RepID=A0A9D5DB22_9LILI|nr:hypothetical protein J5N97_005653 [Dioscorea zingiberensis]
MYFSSPSPATPPPLPGHSSSKKKRRPAGTPDPDAEVVALSPKTLLESDRYVCEICGQGFQRDQNLQMHRRRHKVPWKLVKRDTTESAAAGGGGSGEARKRVYVCPESSCLHHDPAHALGDLVGIKKHFRRKHSAHKQWVCARCGKGYAVQSDYKAHLKTCGTRGHTCDCGRVFSRVESFIEHQDACMANQCIELQLLPTCNNNRSTISTSYMIPSSTTPHEEETIATNLKLSIGPEPRPELDEETRVLEKVRADEARAHAKRQMQMAELEFNNAKRIRLRAQAELDRALALREQAINQINVSMLEITCYACKQRFSLKDQTSPTAASYMSSVVTEGEGENDNQN